MTTFLLQKKIGNVESLGRTFTTKNYAEVRLARLQIPCPKLLKTIVQNYMKGPGVRNNMQRCQSDYGYQVTLCKKTLSCIESVTTLQHSYASCIPGNATEYSKHLFRALDTNKDQRVSFKEIMLGFHHLSSQGSQEERLRIVFQVRSK